MINCWIYGYIQGYKMPKKKVLISIDEKTNLLWNKVAKKHRLSKSAMIESYLIRILNQLDHTSIKDASNYDEILQIKQIEKGLFDYEHDQSV